MADPRDLAPIGKLSLEAFWRQLREIWAARPSSDGAKVVHIPGQGRKSRRLVVLPTQLFPQVAASLGMKVRELVRTLRGSATVIKLDERWTPKGMSLEFHLVTLDGESIAFWQFEDGSVAKVEQVGKA